MNDDQGPNIGRSTANSFGQGFGGCLGVGAAIIFVIIALAVIGNSCSSNSSYNPSPAPASSCQSLGGWDPTC